MSAIQLLESIATNPTIKSQNLNGEHSELAERAREQIADIAESQTQIWCAFFPAKDEEKEKEQKENDDSEDKDEKSSQIVQ